MKKVLSLCVLTVFVVCPAWACRPAPLSECAKSLRVKLRPKTLRALEAKVNGFQKHLSASIPEKGEGRTSCFNNQFAGHYVSAVKGYARKHRNFFCPTQMDQVDAAVKALTDEASPEMKAVSDAVAREKLGAEAKEVRITLDKFIGAHNM